MKRMNEPQRHEDTKKFGLGPIPAEVEELSRVIVDSAFMVHTTLGPGLLESVYEHCLCHELKSRGIPFRSQISLPVFYRGTSIEAGLRMDLIVADHVIVELKAIDFLHPVHSAQLLTYLKLTKLRLGLLINFNVPLIRDGIRRIAL